MKEFQELQRVSSQNPFVNKYFLLERFEIPFNSLKIMKLNIEYLSIRQNYNSNFVNIVQDNL